MNLIVRNQYICINADMTVSGSLNLYEAVFEFDSSWDGFSRTAVFARAGREPVAMLLTDNKCTVPYAVLQHSGYMSVGVFGTKDDIRKPTVWCKPIWVEEGCVDGVIVPDPDPEIYDQIVAELARIDAKFDEYATLEYVDDELALKADADDVYTKAQTDALLAEKADADEVYTKTESDSLLSAKADTASVDASLLLKADKSTTYTKTETDSLLDEKQDALPTIVADRYLYANDEGELEWKQGAGGGAVDSVNGKTGTVVLTGNDINVSGSVSTPISTELGNKQDKITASNKLSYDLLKDTPTIPTVPTVVSAFTNDAGYQNSTQVESAITSKGYQTSAQVETAITSKGYQTASDVQSAISGKADTSYVDTEVARVEAEIPSISGLATETYVNNAVAPKANTADLATVATSGSYNDLSNKPAIPSQLAQLEGDTTHRVVTDAQISSWNNKSDFSGSYNDLSNKPTIPTALSQLSDDSTHRVVTDTEKSAWNNKVTANSAITGATHTKITYDSKGLVTSGSDLSASDIPNLSASKITSGTFADSMIASASTWNAKANASDIPTALSQLSSDATHRLVTDTEKSAWDGKALTPLSGNSDPTSSTIGVEKQLYISYADPDVPTLWVCKSTSPMTWKLLSGGASGGIDLVMLNATLPTTGWTKDDTGNWYSQTISVTGLLASAIKCDYEVSFPRPLLDTEIQAISAAWANGLTFDVPSNGQLKAYTSQAPTVAIPIIISEYVRL